MIKAASQSDVAVLIISAKEGDFESGFEKEGLTKQHTILVKALGIQNLIVAINKFGNEVGFQQRFKQIKHKILPFLKL